MNNINDMLVKLYDLKESDMPTIKDDDVQIKRILSPDIYLLNEFIKSKFNDGWISEVSVAVSKPNATCFIAIKNQKIIGFAAYDATCLGFFGPTGVSEEERGKGIGTVLLFKCLFAMKEMGYAYAIIGSVGGAKEFYKKTVKAIIIEDSHPGVYSRLLRRS